MLLHLGNHPGAVHRGPAHREVALLAQGQHLVQLQRAAFLGGELLHSDGVAGVDAVLLAARLNDGVGHGHNHSMLGHGQPRVNEQAG